MPDPLYSARYKQGFAIVPAAPTGNPLNLRAIHAITAGNVTAIFSESRNLPPVTFPVLAGSFYPFDLAYITASTATLLGLR
jgi:hypothetical protein